MASTRILYNTTSSELGKRVAVAVDRLLDSIPEIRRVKKSLDSAQAGGDYVSLAAELGLPAGEVGEAQAQALWFIMSTADDILNGTNYKEGLVSTSERLAELARLDQG